MSELRAPDPTLTAAAPGYIVEVIPADVYGEPAEAHRVGSLHSSGPMIPANDARWFAVPCRECFPDSPKPGERPCTCLLGPPIYRGSLHFHPDPDLAWQVKS